MMYKQTGEKKMKKLIAYFSASGVTKHAAEQLAAVTGADLYEIRPEMPYSREDLDWRNKQSRSSLEMTDPSSRPALAESVPDVSSYDMVYIGFPIWWGVAPRPVNTFIESARLEDKPVYIFATSGGSGIDYALKDMKKNYPSLDIRGGKLLKGKVESDII